MGIQGLLAALKPYTETANIREYAGQALAVDTSSWLHKSVYSIADHYVECIERNPRKADARCVNVSAKYLSNRIQELLLGAHVSKIYLVMDGKRCPLKAVTNDDRDQRRAENLKMARRYKQQNKREQMYDKYKACIKVTDALTNRVMEKISQQFRHSIEIVWSPYEADAQLAKLCMDGLVSAVITEDSDCLVYSASCGVPFDILYKLDRHSGAVDKLNLSFLFDRSKIPKSKDPSQLETILNTFRLRESKKSGWGGRLFVQSCVLTGCDYAPRQLSGVGLVTAFKFVKNVGSLGSPVKLSQSFEEILRFEVSRKAKADIDCMQFALLLAQSEAVFYYHPVVGRNGRVVYLNEPSSSKYSPDLERFESTDFIGVLLANTNHQSVIPRHVLDDQRRPASPSKKRKQHPSQSLHRPLTDFNASETSSLTSPSSTRIAQAAPPISVSKMTNTYKKYPPKQHPPLQPSSPNVYNPHEAYRRRHKDLNQQKEVNRIVTAKLPVKRKGKKESDNDLDVRREPLSGTASSLLNMAKGDVRAVKRNFLRDGRPAKLPPVTFPERQIGRSTHPQSSLFQEDTAHSPRRRHVTTSRHFKDGREDSELAETSREKQHSSPVRGSPAKALLWYQTENTTTRNGTVAHSFRREGTPVEDPPDSMNDVEHMLAGSSPNLLDAPEPNNYESVNHGIDGPSLFPPLSPNLLEDDEELPRHATATSEWQPSDPHHHRFRRRVTVDPPPRDNEKNDNIQSKTAKALEDQEVTSPFDFYAGVPTPVQNDGNFVDLSHGDEDDDPSPDQSESSRYFPPIPKQRTQRTLNYRIGDVMASNHDVVPKISSSIGPAKTKRSRFTTKGTKTTTSGKLNSIILHLRKKRKPSPKQTTMDDFK